MKIGMIVRRLNVKGGTQRQMLSLARELKRRGHGIKIYTFALDRERCYPELLEGFDIKAAATSPKGLALLMDKDFDILNPHDPGAEQTAYYYKKLVKRVPVVWNMNDTYSYRWNCDKARGVDEYFKKPFWRVLAYALFDRYTAWRYLRHVDAIVVVDDFNRMLTKKYLGLPSVTVRNGPDLEHFTYQERKPLRRAKLLTSGILLPHRRFEDSIEAVKLLREEGHDVTLSIVGDTENDKKYFEKLTALVGTLGVGKYATFLGRISERELLHAYRDHDIYIFQHHLQSDGLSPFEAAASGLPIIVSRTAGSHEVLTDGVNALFIDPKDPKDIADKVRRLMREPELYVRLSREGNDFVRKNFSWQKYTDEVLRVFGEVLSLKRIS